MKLKFCSILLATVTVTTTAMPQARFAHATTHVRAEMTQNLPSTTSCIREPEHYIGPVTLVMLAYQGFLKDRNIPSAAGLIDAYSQGNVTPKQLVEAAINGCVLSSQLKLNENEGYLNMVNEQLRTLETR